VKEFFALVYSYARAAWRRRWWAVATTWMVAVAGWAIVLLLPDHYEASARVYVDARTALQPVLQGIAIEEDYQSQLVLVREALLSRPQMQSVARQTNLDTHVRTPAQLDALVTELQKQIHVTVANPIASRPNQPQDSIYTISYQHPDRDKSIEVVRKLLDNFQEATLSGNRSGASEAQAFLTRQIGELEKRLQDSEARLAEFKKRNVGMIPGGDRGDYFTRLGNEMRGLQDAETNLSVAYSRRAELQRQLARARESVLGTVASGTGGTAGAALEVTLHRQQKEQQLSNLLLRFTEKHPEIIALRQSIEELKAQEAKEVAEMRRDSVTDARPLTVNPMYQEIKTRLNALQVEIAAIEGAAAQHRQEIASLRKFVDQAPEIEQEYTRLTRDYSVTKDQYEQLVARREQAMVSDDAARTGAIRFEGIEPPRAGYEPVWPNRPRLFAVSLVVALLAGIGVALLPHLIVPTFDDVGTLQRALGRPVLGVISDLGSDSRRVIQRQQVRHVVLASALLLAITMLLMAVGGTGARILQGMMP
jgi:polysaccharide chain length determinant protein (PEP-CTERM system associated)